MKLKRTIQVIEYANIAFVIGLVIGVITLVARAKDNRIIILEMLLSVTFILIFLFKKIIVNIYLKRSAYPGVFYAVLEKLHLTENFDSHLTDELMDEIYNPSYSTSEFLSDNNFKTEIGSNKIKLPLIALCIIGGFVLLYYNMEGDKFQKNPIGALMILLFIAMNIFLWIKGKKQENDNDPIAFFKDKVLELPDQKLSWKDIYDWNYQAGSRSTPEKIIICYYDTDKNIKEAEADLSSLNIDKIDFLLLLTHFKGKYG